MTGRSRAADPAPDDAPAAETLADRVARLKLENEAMKLELENRVLRKRVGTDTPQAKEF